MSVWWQRQTSASFQLKLNSSLRNCVAKLGLTVYNEQTLFSVDTNEKKRERERGEKNLQHLADIAGSKDLVNDRELLRIIGREEGGKDAVFRAPSPQQFARSTRRIPTHLLWNQQRGEDWMNTMWSSQQSLFHTTLTMARVELKRDDEGVVLYKENLTG